MGATVTRPKEELEFVASIVRCIPPVTSSDIVWVTKGTGDYLNLSDHPWSPKSASAPESDAGDCFQPGPVGTLVIDDATGDILGVLPGPARFPAAIAVAELAPDLVSMMEARLV